MRILAIAAVSTVAWAPMAQAIPVGDIYSSFISFGDSLSDNGKFQSQTVPSFEGRFSNGLTYAEILAQLFPGSGNFALGGATAGAINANVFPAPLDNLANFDSQITAFQVAPEAFGGLAGDIGDNPLVSVFFGANDLLQDLTATLTTSASTMTAPVFDPSAALNAASEIGAGIRRLAASDPSLDDFLVLDLPDLGGTPLFAGTPAEPLASAATNAFNQALAVEAADLRAEGLNVSEFSVNDVFQDILSGDLLLPGVTDVTGQCIPEFNVITSEADFLAQDPSTNCALNEDFSVDIAAADETLFVDSIHPNRVAHETLAELIEEELSVVPLPATLPLFLVGLGGCAILRRRARS